MVHPGLIPYAVGCRARRSFRLSCPRTTSAGPVAGALSRPPRACFLDPGPEQTHTHHVLMLYTVLSSLHKSENRHGVFRCSTACGDVILPRLPFPEALLLPNEWRRYDGGN
jgi:hypothetical protein